MLSFSVAIEVAHSTESNYFRVLFSEVDYVSAIETKQSVFDYLTGNHDRVDTSLMPILDDAFNEMSNKTCKVSNLPILDCESCLKMVHLTHDKVDAVKLVERMMKD